jgi:preprotein translocase subunit SecG
MKVNISLVLAILFIALSIWLSFSVKKANDNMFQSETQVKELERELGIRKYQLEIMHEALALNIGKTPIPTRQTTQSRPTSTFK